jgi:hypothetical protein
LGVGAPAVAVVDDAPVDDAVLVDAVLVEVCADTVFVVVDAVEVVLADAGAA